MTMCRMSTPTSILIRNCWRKLRDSRATSKESSEPPFVGGFRIVGFPMRGGRAEVFNMMVENSVEKPHSILVSDSARVPFSILHWRGCWHLCGTTYSENKI